MFRNPFRPGLEALGDRVLPAVDVWLGHISTNFNTAGNWSLNAVPVAGDDIVYQGEWQEGIGGPAGGEGDDPNPIGGYVSYDCVNMHAASGGDYNSVTLDSNYTGRVTLSGGFGTGDFNLAGGKIDQPSSGTDIAVTGIVGITSYNAYLLSGLPANFTWTGGIVNSTSNLANLVLDGATGSLAPTNGGTVYLGSNINLENGAAVTQGAGTINVTNADLTFTVNANCSYDVNPGAGFSAFISSIFSTHFRVTAGSAYTLHENGIWSFSGDVRNQGTFSLMGESVVSILGLGIPVDPNDPDSLYLYLQTSGATYLYGSSLLSTGRGAKFSAGILATKYAATETSNHDCSASVTADILEFREGDIYIGYGASHLAFGTLDVNGRVNWSGGTYHPCVRSYANGSVGESDLWHSTGRFEVYSGTTLTPIVVDAEGAVVDRADSGKNYVIVKADTASDPPPEGSPSYDTILWDLINIAPLNDNTKVVQYNLMSK